MTTKARQLAEFIANADVDSDEIATGAVSASKLAATLDLSGKTISMPDVAAFNITSGNIGIGHTSPDQALDVKGNFTLRDTTGNLSHGMSVFGDNDQYAIFNQEASGDGGLRITTLSDASSATSAFQLNAVATTPSTDGNNAAIRLRAAKKNGSTETSLASTEDVLSIGNVGTELVVVKGSGNVGIGTTTPPQELSVVGQINIDETDYARVEYARNTTNIWSAGLRTGNNFHIYRESGNGSVEIPNGNVLIGTTDANPVTNNVAGTSLLDGGGTRVSRSGEPGGYNRIGSDGTLINFRKDGATVGKIGTVSGKLVLGGGPSAGSDVTIDDSGRVGIGTTNPLSGLHLSDGTNAGAPQNSGRQATLMIDAGATASADLQFMVRDGYNSHIFFGDATDPNVGMLWYQHNNNSMYFSTNASQRMTITGSGTVSIEKQLGETSSGVSGAAGGSLDLNGGTAFTGRLLFTGVNDSGTNLIGFNNESNGLVMYDYTEDQYIMKTNNDQKVSFGGSFPNVSGSSTRVYNLVVDDGISIGDAAYTHGFIGTNGTDGDVYIASNAYPANLSGDRSVIIAGGTIGGGGPKEVVRYNPTDGARRDYSGNTGNNRKWWSTTNTNFGEVYEYDYGNKLYFKKTRDVGGYAQCILINRYMPNQYDVSFELTSGSDANNNPYRHFGIALNHVGTENTSQFDYVVLRQRYGNSNLNQIRIDQPGGTAGNSEGSSIPNFHDETKRKVMIQKRASTLRIQIHELNSTVYTYGTITGINWTNSSGYFGFSIYEAANSTTWAEISNLTFTDVIA